MKDVYLFGPFRVDARKRRLWKGEQLVPLTPKAFETLLALVRQAGEVVEKDHLLEIVWPNVHVSEETLTQNISTIRKALGDTSEHPEYVATVPRRGYQFISAVNEAGLGDPVALADPVVSTSGPPLAPTKRRDVRKFGWVGPAVLSMMIGAALAFAFRRPASGPLTAAEWEVNPPEGTALVSGGALSPDGQRLAFVTTDLKGHEVLRVRVLGSGEAPAVPGTEGARDPFWSPDSRSIAFCAGGKLKRTDLSGQPPRTVAEVDRTARGGTWSQSGIILLPAAFKSALFRINVEEGGTPVQLTTLADGERAHVWPSFLPDGRHFVYRVVGLKPEQSGTYLGSLDSTVKARLLDASSSAAIYAPPGYLLFVRDGSLVAQRLDLASRRLEGPVFPLAASVAAPDDYIGLSFSAAHDRVAYVAGGTHVKLEWFDREGRSRGVLDGTAAFTTPSLSPDDTKVLAMRLESETDTQIWQTSSAGGTPSRLGTGLARGGLPVWSPDGLSVAFTSGGSLYRVPLRGGRPPELLLKPETTIPLRADDWSPDGRALVYMATSATSGMDIWWLSLDDGAAHPFDATRFNELQGQVSPDNRWIAYTSDESGTWEVYVQAFPNGGSKQKVSKHGGAQPMWRRSDGGELFFLARDQTMMSVDVRAGSPDGLSMGPPQALFAVRLAEELTRRRNYYAVTRNGKRFLVTAVQPFRPPLKVKLNWTANLR